MSINLSKIISHALSRGFDEAAVAYYKLDRVMIKFANSQPSVSQSWIEYIATLYLVKDKRIMVSVVESVSEEEVVKKINEAINQVGSLERSFIYAPLPEPDPNAKPLQNLVSSKVLDFLRDPSGVSEIIVNKASEERIERFAGAIDSFLGERCVATSKNFEACEKSTYFSFYIRAFLGEGSGHWGFGASSYETRDLEETVSLAAHYAKESSKNIKDIEPGVYDVILSPLVVGNFLGYISMALNGLNKITGMSFFAKNNPGDQVASDKLTLVDDPFRNDMFGSAGFDDEGISTRRNVLIEKGVLKTFIHNTKTASVLGTSSTGNAGWITPRPWNLVIVPGDMDESEMIRGVRRGLLINNNWYTRYQNAVEGIFSTVTRDALLIIENGEIKGSAKRMRIADSFPRLLRNIAGLGKRVYKAKWWEIRESIETPYIYIRDVNITKPF
ncbi:MAG: TldD/PmbA family protein [Sulfolobales archaeon]